MFNVDFYPTPAEICQMMIAGEDLTGKTVLEPSAGKGDIVDHLKQHGANVLTCEKNPDLARIVSGKSKLIKDDFLQVQPHQISHIHAIYMNPPFSADEKHILHAWDIAPSGCHIVALCNWNTINNTYSSYRKQLQSLVSNYGSSQNLGPAFDNSERKTGVEIGLVNLYKPKSDNNFGDYFDSSEDDFENQENGIMSYNAVRDVVQRYVNACILYDKVIETGIQMNSLVGTLGVKDLSFTCTEDKKDTTKEEFQKELQKKAWKWIFSKMNMDKFMTASLKADINKFVEDQTKIPFTMKNIYKMFELVIGTHGQRMEKVLIEVFDKLTSHYHENRWNLEGWKTNSHYLVNRKFILNHVLSTSWGGGLEVQWTSYGGHRELMDDLCKALSYITADQQTETLHEFTHRKDFKMQPNTWYDWNFFEIKGFKKGTIHCRFKDENVWGLFNQAVAKAKGYELPENMRKAA